MFSTRLGNALTPAIGALAFIFIWWLVASLKLIDPVLLPSPQDSAIATWEGFVRGNLLQDALITIRRTLLAFGIAIDREGDADAPEEQFGFLLTLA